jgi:thiazole/oxazole-forming peptide maturase SagD family component
MDVVVRHLGSVQDVEALTRRLVHPLCGMATRVGFVRRGRYDPRFVVAGAELSGVHRRLGLSEPGSYHIGGVGLTRQEALVRALGETAERYGQLISVVSGRMPIRRATIAELEAEGARFVDPTALVLFVNTQLERVDFPFTAPQKFLEYGWTTLTHVATGEPAWVPAQLVLVGYAVHRPEPWLAPAVTTGTATHRTVDAARRGALLELIQVDAAMGHWYGPNSAPRIEPGAEIAPVKALMARYLGPVHEARFHYVASPDLPALCVACVIEAPSGRKPVVAVGLGVETSLGEACYRALLEAVGVIQLVKIGMMMGALDGTAVGAVRDENTIFDLDSNVSHYASGAGADIVERKFPSTETIPESELVTSPPSLGATTADELSDAILAAGHSLYEADLTTPDVAHLGLATTRVWSPDLLPICMPSAPFMAHPRYASYGGAAHERPHPYP